MRGLGATSETHGLRRAVRVCYGIIGVFASARGVAYLPHARPEPLPGGVAVISEHIPVTVWAAVWLAAAALCFISCVTPHPHRWSSWGVIFMCTGWGMGYLAAALAKPSATAQWLGATTYFLWAALIISGTYIAVRAALLARLIDRKPNQSGER